MNCIISHGGINIYKYSWTTLKKKKIIIRKISYNKRIDLQSFPRLQLLRFPNSRNRCATSIHKLQRMKKRGK